MKIVCAYMVVAIHSNPFKEFNSQLHFIFAQVIPRIAVPFFLTVSGYFFINSLVHKKNITKKYLKRLIITYSLWSLIYFIFQIITRVNKTISLIPLIKTNIKNYLFFGTWYHLWYFPALIFCIITVYFFNKIKALKFLYIISLILYIIGLLGSSYFKIGYKITILSKLYAFSHFNLIRRILLVALPFFMVGYMIILIENKIKNSKNKALIILLILFILLFIGEIILITLSKIGVNIITTLFLYPLTTIILILCLKNPFSKMDKYTNHIKCLPNLTYYIHPLFMSITSLTTKNLWGFNLTQTPMFLVTCFVTLITSIFLTNLNNKWVNKFIY